MPIRTIISLRRVLSFASLMIHTFQINPTNDNISGPRPRPSLLLSTSLFHFTLLCIIAFPIDVSVPAYYVHEE